jgi:hypothetical protein
VRWLRVVIWIATAVFVALLFYPLVSEMFARFRGAGTDGLP